MKETEIHNGFPDEEVRKTLATTIRLTTYKEMENEKPTIRYKGDKYLYEWDIENSRNEIIYYQNRIEISQMRLGMRKILEMYGWDEHDVSDYIRMEEGEKLCLSFIGTKEEYKRLMKTLTDEDEKMER